MMPLAIVMIFIYAPRERVMGDVQRIFYFHVASAWTGFFAFFIVFAASILFLRSRKNLYHLTARASAEIGVIFTTFVLVSGMLWARAAWNTWWTWDARLTTTLIMWFIYLGYLFLISAAGGGEKSLRRLAAVYGVVAFVNVPLVFMSIRWWRTMHPVVIDMEGGGLTSRMIVVLVYSLITLTLLYFSLLGYRRRQLEQREELNRLRSRIEKLR